MHKPTYHDSLNSVIKAEARYYAMCGEYGEGEGLSVEAFLEFQQAKRDHREWFGSLTRVNGQWV